MRRFLAILLVAVFASAPCLTGAAELVFTLDPAASSVSFVLDATMHKVHGTLPLTSGELRFDPGSGAASGVFQVDATKAATGNSGRDKKMHAEVLESRRFPAMTYRVTKVEGQLAESGKSELRFEGSLSLHGSDHPLTVPVVVELRGESAVATATFRIPYVEWGLKDPSAFVLRVAKFVDVEVHATGRLAR